jgi:[ribosomal protein S5]-alanine N-acetyltransferase
MAFLRASNGPDHDPEIRGRGVTLRAPTMTDYASWAELRAQSRAHLTPWEPQWSRDELSRSAFRRRLRHYSREWREDLGYAFFIFRAGDGALLGGLTVSNVRRGVAQTATLGYWLGERYCGRGHMTDAVAAAMPFLFNELRLHRIEAACLPQNSASIRVLEKCGFKSEGVARQYLRIAGAWQDHLLFAMLDGDLRGDASPMGAA